MCKIVTEQRDEERKCRFCKIVFLVCFAISVALLIGGFLVPPTGEISGSVLTAVGELFAFPALAFGFRAVELGYDLKMSKGDASVELTNN